jgi:hypothetical protein
MSNSMRITEDKRITVRMNDHLQHECDAAVCWKGSKMIRLQIRRKTSPTFNRRALWIKLLPDCGTGYRQYNRLLALYVSQRARKSLPFSSRIYSFVTECQKDQDKSVSVGLVRDWMVEESSSINCSGKIFFWSPRVQRCNGVKQLPIQCLRRTFLMLSICFTM